MNAWWANLSERDRWAAGLGAAFLLCYLFYLLVYSPLMASVVFKRDQLLEKKQTLAWMQQVQDEAGSGKTAESITRNKLLTVMATRLDNGPLKPFRYLLQQTGQGEISLSFDAVPYSDFLTWLWELSQEYAISLEQFSVERTATPGVVKSMVLISVK